MRKEASPPAVAAPLTAVPVSGPTAGMGREGGGTVAGGQASRDVHGASREDHPSGRDDLDGVLASSQPCLVFSPPSSQDLFFRGSQMHLPQVVPTAGAHGEAGEGLSVLGREAGGGAGREQWSRPGAAMPLLRRESLEAREDEVAGKGEGAEEGEDAACLVIGSQELRFTDGLLMTPEEGGDGVEGGRGGEARGDREGERDKGEGVGKGGSPGSSSGSAGKAGKTGQVYLPGTHAASAFTRIVTPKTKRTRVSAASSVASATASAAGAAALPAVKATGQDMAVPVKVGSSPAFSPRAFAGDGKESPNETVQQSQRVPPAASSLEQHQQQRQQQRKEQQQHEEEEQQQETQQDPALHDSHFPDSFPTLFSPPQCTPPLLSSQDLRDIGFLPSPHPPAHGHTASQPRTLSQQQLQCLSQPQGQREGVAKEGESESEKKQKQKQGEGSALLGPSGGSDEKKNHVSVDEGARAGKGPLEVVPQQSRGGKQASMRVGVGDGEQEEDDEGSPASDTPALDVLAAVTAEAMAHGSAPTTPADKAVASRQGVAGEGRGKHGDAAGGVKGRLELGDSIEETQAGRERGGGEDEEDVSGETEIVEDWPEAVGGAPLFSPDFTAEVPMPAIIATQARAVGKGASKSQPGRRLGRAGEAASVQEATGVEEADGLAGGSAKESGSNGCQTASDDEVEDEADLGNGAGDAPDFLAPRIGAKNDDAAMRKGGLGGFRQTRSKKATTKGKATRGRSSKQNVSWRNYLST